MFRASTLYSHASPEDRISTKGWSMDELLKRGSNFRPVPTFNVEDASLEEVVAVVKHHEESGIPLMLQNWHKRSSWDPELLSASWLENWQDAGSEIQVRNVYTWDDRAMCLVDYLKYARSTTPFATPEETERLYAKDAPFPTEWDNWLQENLPEYVLNFKSGDISSTLNPELQFESLMTYIGIGDTFTPGHKDLCGSVGQNLMLYAENGGCSFWFMAATEDAREAGSYWRDLGHELDLETHVATVDEFSKAPFPVYICQQAVGDFVIVPPSSCHQVINSCGLTVKIAWSRMIPKSLDIAIKGELRIYQRVCRNEVYRTKTTVAVAIQNCVKEWNSRDSSDNDGLQPLALLLLQLLPLYKQMMIESYDVNHASYLTKALDGESCHCCGADVWQSAFVCDQCNIYDPPSSEVGYIVICPPCYLDGRSCRCRTMQPVQDRPFAELLELGNTALQLLSMYRSHDSIPVFAEDSLYAENVPPYFRMSCFLHLFRRETELSNNKRSRQCNTYRNLHIRRPDQDPHPIPTDSGAICEGCHLTHCFRHTLEKFNIHCASLLLRIPAYMDIQKGESANLKPSLVPHDWHRLHNSSRSSQSKEKYPSFDSTWEEWLPCLASMYQPQRYPGSSIVLGWYDEIESYSLRINNGATGRANDRSRRTKRKKPQLSSSSSELTSLTSDEYEPRPSARTNGKGPARKRPRTSKELSSDDALSMDVTKHILPKRAPAPNVKRQSLSTTSRDDQISRLLQRVEHLERAQDVARVREDALHERLQSLEAELSSIKAGTRTGEQPQSNWHSWY
ncbi:hypothetical protein FRC20_001836 [Serendipita sp. 405]|nr:hypothetical protein FRC20_001836 [Serendipita sp. 405]